VKKNYLMLLLCAMLSGCGGGAVVEQSFNPAPTLVGFDIVDSYGVDSGYSTKALTLDPYINNGLFDVFWKANSLYDYRVNIRVNATPDISNSLLIYSDICGAGRACDQGGSLICEYTSDFYLSCNNARNPTDIASLMKRVPQNLYVMLEVCDLNSPTCSYRYYPVSMQ
jgi:hypothetical protein